MFNESSSQLNYRTTFLEKTVLRCTVGSLRSAIGLLAADVGTTWVAREGAQQGARHHNA